MDDNYINWRQDDPRYNVEPAWDAESFPDANYRFFHECGCFVCALAIMLRHNSIEKETDESRFNPWILNQRLIEIGAFDSYADLEIEDIPKLYQVEYLGDFPYSREIMEKYAGKDFACLITVPGQRAAEHFTAFYELLDDDVLVIDPIRGKRRLSEYERVYSIRVFRII